jgi:signal transduction histidine kinase
LTAALTRLSETTTAMAKIKCNFHWRSGVELSDATKAIHLYRIAQEAVNNAVRHGKAAAIDLSLERMNGSLHLTVQDNGFGFSLNNPAEGMGLAAMRYRADLIGATFTIDSQPGKGTHIHCRLPERK